MHEGSLHMDRDMDRAVPVGSARVDGGSAPFETIPGDMRSGCLLLCDHASNALPPGYGTLGLSESQLARHIGYDIGAEAVTRALADLLDLPAVLNRHSRLLIDPNRGPDDPTLIMRLSDGVVIPGNARITDEEREFRKTAFHDPYHEAIGRTLDRLRKDDRTPVILSLHSFTPTWRGTVRPWHAGVLWDRDGRLARPLISALKAEGDLVVGDNEPYTGELEGDTLNRHGTRRGFAHALVEIRQDLIADESGARSWAERLARILSPTLKDETLYRLDPALKTN